MIANLIGRIHRALLPPRMVSVTRRPRYFAVTRRGRLHTVVAWGQRTDGSIVGLIGDRRGGLGPAVGRGWRWLPGAPRSIEDVSESMPEVVVPVDDLAERDRRRPPILQSLQAEVQRVEAIIAEVGPQLAAVGAGVPQRLPAFDERLEQVGQGHQYVVYKTACQWVHPTTRALAQGSLHAGCALGRGTCRELPPS